MQIRVAALCLLLIISNRLSAQSCTTLGQTPATAFPVCGTTTFSQSNVPICSSHALFVPGCSGDGADYEDKNPFWYKFTCYTSGTLGFLITPNNMNDDYDWMLYDITGHNPNDVFTDHSLIVTGNWSGTEGKTGATAAGVAFVQCASDPADNKPSYSKMPNLIAGHQYLLLVSHFTDSQSGYQLSFGGGTAVITDPLLPALQQAWSGCGGVSIMIKLNKKMKCSSLATDGSDFSISPAPVASIVAARGVGCGNSFDMDTVVLTMSGPLVPGNYLLTAEIGSDGNTLLDNCNHNIPQGQHIPFTVIGVQPTPMDSLTPVACAPDKLQLFFRRPIRCSSIAADGTDFVVSGSTPVTVTGATGNCINGLTTSITVNLANPIQTAGIYQVQLVKGSDGNTIIDECLQETPPGAALPFTTSDMVNAAINYQIIYDCTIDSVRCSHNGLHGVNQWNWNFNNEGTSTLQNPSFGFTVFGVKNIELTVSNGVCSATSITPIELDNTLKAGFAFPDLLCPEDAAVFTDQSIGKIISWKWTFGDGGSSFRQDPGPYRYPRLTVNRTWIYRVQLVVENDLHCFDTVSHNLKVVNNCFIAVPNGFTPNGDGHNDYLYPLNAYKAVNLEFMVYNRYGQVVFRTTDWTRKWDGTFNGQQQPTGVFAWTLHYTDRDTRQQFFRKGTVVLIR